MTVQLSTLGAVIKTAYEAQANTNAFTDALKEKLENLSGTSWIFGSGAPDDTEDGVDGDLYLDVDTGDVYGPKDSGAWGAISLSLKGADGDRWAVVTAEVTESRDLDTADAGKYIPVNDDAEVIMTLQTQADANWDADTEILLEQVGTGKISVVGDVGVTVRKPTGKLASSAAQGAVIGLKRVAADVWTLSGLLEDEA